MSSKGDNQEEHTIIGWTSDLRLVRVISAVVIKREISFWKLTCPQIDNTEYTFANSPREIRQSKKALKTNTKKISIENDMEELKSMLKTVMQDVKDIKTDQKAYQEEMRSVREENAKLRERLLALELKVESKENSETHVPQNNH